MMLVFNWILFDAKISLELLKLLRSIGLVWGITCNPEVVADKT